MRFLVDECTGPVAASWLLSQSHDVFSVFDQARGMSDDEVITKAHSENWILLTNDKDFGEQVYREKKPHCGIVLLRLHDEGAAAKINALQRILTNHTDQLANRFVVVTETQARFAPA